MEKEKISETKVIIITTVITIVLFLVIPYIYLILHNFSNIEDKNKMLDKPKMIISEIVENAKYRNDYYDIDCTLADDKVFDEKSVIKCEIKLNKNVITKEDKKSALEYFQLNYHNTEDTIVVNSYVDGGGKRNIYIPYFLRESMDNTSLKILMRDDYAKNLNIYKNCGYYRNKNTRISLVCPTVDEVILFVELKILDFSKDIIKIDNFDDLYTYSCFYGETEITCNSYKYKGLISEVEIPEEMKEQKEEDKKEDKSEQIVIPKEKLTDEEIEANELISYVPNSFPFGRSFSENDMNMYYSAFSNKKLTVREMNANWIILNIMRKMRENNYSYYNDGKTEYLKPGEKVFEEEGDCYFYKIEHIKEYLNRYYGEADIELPEILKGDILTDCKKHGDFYVCRCEEGGDITSDIAKYFGLYSIGHKTLLITKYDKREIVDDTLNLYVKFARVEFETSDDFSVLDNTSFKLYKNSTGNELLINNTFYGKDFYDLESSKSFKTRIYEQFKDKMLTYKIAYKKYDNNYILLSVEPIKN